MAFAVRRVVKLAGAGIGLGREAYLYHKEKKEKDNAQSTDVGELSNSMHRAHVSDTDNIYVQLPEYDANDLIAKGHAIPATEEEQRDLKKVEYEDDEDDSDSIIDDYDLDDVLEDIDHDWQLDEEAGLPLPPAYDDLYGQPDEKSQQAAPHDEQQARPASKLVYDVVASASPIPATHTPLSFPVIMPQRRPGSKSRGFVRAYAPDLAATGISQETFMMFLNNFDEASRASPILTALYATAGIVGMVPGIITLAVSISVQVAAGTAMALESRYKANAYLDQINKDLFMPRGLYAIVMRYKPQESVPGGQTELGLEDINLHTAKSIARWAPSQNPAGMDTGPSSTGTRIIKRIRVASGTTRGEATMPTRCAPLIFPTADGGAKVERSFVHDTATVPSSSLPSPSPFRPEKQSQSQLSPTSSTATSTNDKGKRPLKDKVKSASAFINDYYDRRAQAEYLAQNPDTTLSKQITAPQFRSRYADPTSSTNSHLFNLLTGGHAQVRSIEERRAAKRERKNERRIARGRAPRGNRRRRERRDGKPRGPVGLVVKGVKKVLKEDVLYLMVVNMPSREEMAEARRVLLENGWMK